MQSKKIARISAILILVIIITMGAAIFLSPNAVDKSFQNTLKDNGFEITNIGAIEKRIGAIRYTEIALGAEEKSSINTLTIKYKPLFLNKIKSIKIGQSFLSGNIDIHGKLTINGLKSPQKLTQLTNSSLQNISIQNLNISILSAHFGGIRGTANATAQRKENALIWNGTIDSRQDQLELIAKINAQTNDSGTWVADMDIENAKLERSFGKITRVNGALSINGNKNEWNTAASDIHAPTFGSMINYFKRQNMMPLNDAQWNAFKPEANPTLTIQNKTNGLSLSLVTPSQTINARGQIQPINAQNLRIKTAQHKSTALTLNEGQCQNAAKNNIICTLNIIQKNGIYSIKD